MKIQLSTDSGSLDALEEVGLTGSGGFSIPALEGTAECLSGEAPPEISAIVALSAPRLAGRWTGWP
jgi:hypothetical protein